MQNPNVQKYLDVPYCDKDAVKRLGAKWDPERKKWYVPHNLTLEPFEEWGSLIIELSAHASTNPKSYCQEDLVLYKNRLHRVVWFQGKEEFDDLAITPVLDYPEDPGDIEPLDPHYLE